MEILGGKTDYEGIFTMLNKKAIAAQSPIDNANENRGLSDALKYYFSGSDDQTSVFSAKGDLPTNVTPEGVKSATGFESVAALFPRIAIVILGFIFVAVGLAMFKAPQNINIVSSAAKAL